MSEWKCARYQQARVLQGQYCRLEPLQLTQHKTDLFRNLLEGDKSAVWEFANTGPFASQEAFDVWLAQVAASDDLVWVVVAEPHTVRTPVDTPADTPADTGRTAVGALGVVGLSDIHPEWGTACVGPVVWSTHLRSHVPIATETLYLLAKDVFDHGYRRLEWRVNTQDVWATRRAERAGFKLEGVLHQHRMTHLRQNQDTAIYALLDKHWGPVGAAFDLWLAPANFDENGLQKKDLEAFRDSV